MKISHIFILFITCVSASAGYSQILEFRGESRDGLTPLTVKEAEAATSFLTSLKFGLGGKMTIRVNVDATGMVSEAMSVSGPGDVCTSVTRPDIVRARAASMDAAKLVRFNPARLNSQPTASYGWIYFDPEKLPKNAERNGQPVDNSEVRFTAKGDSAPNSSPESEKALDQMTVSDSPPKSHAVSLPQPSYPAAARAVRATGTVEIRVLIETDGSVFSAVAISGHPLLRAAARNAACEAKFTPTILSGEPVKLYGTVNYNFVP